MFPALPISSFWVQENQLLMGGCALIVGLAVIVFFQSSMTRH